MREIKTIHWIDAVFSNDAEPGLSKCMSVGFLLEEDDESVLIAMEVHTIDGEESFRHYLRIPQVCIREIEL